MNVKQVDKTLQVGELIIFKDRNFQIESINTDVCMFVYTNV